MIVRTFRAAARTIGTVIDEEDRELLARTFVIAIAAVLAVVVAAGAFGLAVSAYEFTRGL